MNVLDTAIPDIKLIQPTVLNDARGFFYENIHAQKLNSTGLHMPMQQENISRSSKGTLRGLHYQISPYEQAKWVHVVVGHIFDVAVDIRPESNTYGQWMGVHLSDKNRHMLVIPQGFAHGFYVLSDTADVVYKCDALYYQAAERAIRWNDPTLGIDWPLLADCPVQLSDKDRTADLFQP